MKCGGDTFQASGGELGEESPPRAPSESSQRTVLGMRGTRKMFLTFTSGSDLWESICGLKSIILYIIKGL